jgi:hypothetical protein
MGTMKLTVFGDAFNRYFPILLVVMCLFNLFNVYTAIVGKCCIPKLRKFVFDETLSDAHIEQGKVIILEGTNGNNVSILIILERENMLQGIDTSNRVLVRKVLSADYNFFSLSIHPRKLLGFQTLSRCLRMIQDTVNWMSWIGKWPYDTYKLSLPTVALCG